VSNSKVFSITSSWGAAWPAAPLLRALRIPGQGGRDSEIDPVSIPKLIRSRFRDEVGQGFRF
jgi:hypothetical protein